MIRSIELRHFRSFKHSKVSDLALVNVIVGNSGSGKTSLLEAIFVAGTNGANQLLKFRRWRGLGNKLEVSMTRPSFESLWDDLFLDFDNETPFEVRMSGNGPGNRSVVGRYSDGGPEEIALPLNNADGPPQSIRPFRLDWTLSNGRTDESEISIKNGALSHTQGKYPSMPLHFLNSVSLFDDPEESTKLFSKLKGERREGELLTALRQAYPKIEELSLVHFGGTLSIAVAHEGLNHLLPLALTSSGATKLTFMLLAMANARGGALLLDEIENGFHHSSIGRVWELVYGFAKQFNVQIFASTHSNEALQALLPVLKGHEENFRLLRCSTGGTIEQFEGSQFSSAVESGFEIRG